MSAKHTPGPWSWDGDVCNYDPENEAPWIIAGKRGELAVLRGQIECDNPADAALLIAAPDLLEALRGFVDNIVPNDPNDPLWQQARAALAKATGAQS